ncbi:IS1/IS1595 family N-terminal zinc-binding domain-containing protein [Synechococcus elongatus]|uniref:IS1/IS1595 family N-terminal zinc-binding domain-containing protein n=1 Tax=Synechococcus elongatus TaxID=32046 RepID=UPI0005853BC9|nr:IS1 family transposase [Synechococcus elongatus]AJD58665.1 hypothetical protein M744_12890 [Synechococcus elongatus UTEX 2973]MBD2588666.1 IS1 family transposase [Synechococcus elongatus FACHB-242]MBD2689745.1 IS1 family transposase [Synechococcus elongatus FACHB-1061]MBD2708352.1 IS1 family transposase [Synechococcus elongatus PCC 7942 = FACHB-805]UOW70564.1 hypothetical protein PCC7943_0803 [Synechococcus elongatus PCC 7943]
MTCPPCPNCSSCDVIRYGHSEDGRQRWRCKSCRRSFTGGSAGRPTLGDRPLTATERQRRWRAKKRQQQ